NMYGDETSASMISFSQLVVGKTEASIPGMSAGLNSYFTAIGNPAYPSNAQVAGAVGLFAPYGAAAQAAVQNALPFYIGLRNNYFGNASVSRTGYEEQRLVDYNTLNAKLTGGIYFKITPTIEASFNSYFGTGTTVYTGADRYSLRNLKIAQHKLEVKAKNWFVRAYTTQENAGESYNASALAGYLNEYWKPSSSWFPQYIGTFSETKRLTSGTLPDLTIHSLARTAADAGRLIPGTAAFDNAVKKIRSTPIKRGGALFLDKSDLWAGEAQLNLSDAANFSDKIEIIAGFQYKQWIMNSQGTIFADTLGNIDISEYGGYIQFRKKFLDDKLTFTASGRYDKQTNFGGKFTPRFTGLLRVAKDNFIRASYQTAYRFPTNQDQYISLVTGSGSLIGCLPEFQSYYKLNSTLPGYTPSSILLYRASGNPANVNLLVKGTYSEVKPETVSSYELGYKGIIKKKLLVDAYVYYSHYRDFLGRAAVGQATPSSGSGTVTDLYSPFTTTNVSYIQNSSQGVKATGWGIGIDYQAMKNYFLYGNIFSDKLGNVPAGLVTFFNAPKYRWNLGLRNENVCHHIGFNIVVKWQDDNYYEGTFVTGTLPSFITVDAQVTYRPPNTKAVFRIGGTNFANSYNRTGYGSPAVGGLYYMSYGYNLF
ncbi:MAG: TonB-dependent receptor, partial [Bacteroidia bacterium]|nr:TonB-dependent receptor [Bacteroidia bacterium]